MSKFDDEIDYTRLAEAVEALPEAAPATQAPRSAPAVTPAPVALPSLLVEGRAMFASVVTEAALDSAARCMAAKCNAAFGEGVEHPTRLALRAAYKARKTEIARVAWVAMFCALWLRIWGSLRDAIEERPSLVVRPQVAPPPVVAPGTATVTEALAAVAASPVTGAAPAFGSIRTSGFVAPTSRGGTFDDSPLTAAEIAERDRNRAARAAREAERAARAARPAVVTGEGETMREVRQAMRSGEILAVTDAVASGKAFSWDGQGEFTRADLLAVLRAAGLPESWAPSPTSPKALAGLVVTGENRHGLIAKPERLGKGSRKARVVVGADGMPRQYVSRWTIQEPSHGNVGEHAGTILATATVWVDGSITVDGDPTIKARVETEYNRRRDEEVYEAGQVTAWLQSTICREWHAIKHYGWYIPARHVDAAMRLYNAIKSQWGNWRIPMPMVTCDALRAGLTKSLADEVNRILADIEREHQAGLVATPRRMQLTPTRAAAFLAQLSELGARAGKHVEVLGGEYATKVRDGIAVAMRSLEDLCTPGDVRASLLELDRNIDTNS